MHEYEICNVHSGEYDYIYGYTFENALKRNKLNPNEWEFVSDTYMD